MGGILGRRAWERSNGGLWLPEVHWSPMWMGFCCCEEDDAGECCQCTNTPRYVVITLSGLGDGYSVESGVAYTCEFQDALAPTYCIWQWGSYPYVLALQLCVDPVGIPPGSATLAFYEDPGGFPVLTFLHNAASPTGNCITGLNGYTLDNGGYDPSAEVAVP